jgi:hypothetical protein
MAGLIFLSIISFPLNLTGTPLIAKIELPNLNIKNNLLTLSEELPDTPFFSAGFYQKLY